MNVLIPSPRLGVMPYSKSQSLYHWSRERRSAVKKPVKMFSKNSSCPSQQTTPNAMAQNIQRLAFQSMKSERLEIFQTMLSSVVYHFLRLIPSSTSRPPCQDLTDRSAGPTTRLCVSDNYLCKLLETPDSL